MADKIKPERYWKDLEITLQEARRVKKKHDLKTLPCAERLNEMGYGGLGASIEKYHGSLVAFRKILEGRLGISSENRSELEGLVIKYMGVEDERRS